MGLGAAFIRLPATALEAAASEVHAALVRGSFNDVVALLTRGPHRSFNGWDSRGWALPGVLELLCLHYGDHDERLAWCRSDATRNEWRAHLDGVSTATASLLSCYELTVIRPHELAALRLAFERAEADGWAKFRSDTYVVDRAALEALFVEPGADELDVWLQEGDGEFEFRSPDDFAEVRAPDAVPPFAQEDTMRAKKNPRSKPMHPALAFFERVAGLVLGGLIGVFKYGLAGIYLLLAAAVPLLAYPALVPSMLRSGDLLSTAMLIGIIGAMGALPLALVWKKMPRWLKGLAVAAHPLGLAIGGVRYLIERP